MSHLSMLMKVGIKYSMVLRSPCGLAILLGDGKKGRWLCTKKKERRGKVLWGEERKGTVVDILVRRYVQCLFYSALTLCKCNIRIIFIGYIACKV